MRTVEVAGKVCHIAGDLGSGRVVYYGTHADAADDVHEISKLVAAEHGKVDFAIVAFEEPDWNGAFSPWPSPAVNAGGDFAGNGSATLRWLVEECVPRVERDMGDESARYVAGYSLAGLFALWALGETDVFAGAMSASGSLWFPGFAEHAAGVELPKGASVYLSYGVKEERTRNAAMATVGDATRSLAAQLAANPSVARSTIVANPGGHFTNPIARTASAISWLLQP